ncbi:hypothetical protein ZWY2020_057978 [Hordeum vulgare]|nr:hypothetical protein ZWY2020_057978 [Hordeum vulgare]
MNASTRLAALGLSRPTAATPTSATAGSSSVPSSSLHEKHRLAASRSPASCSACACPRSAPPPVPGAVRWTQFQVDVEPSAAFFSILDEDIDASPYHIASFNTDPNMKQLQGILIDIETDAEQLLLARHQLVENDRMRNANREALTALRKRAKTTKTSVPYPFEIVMKGTSTKQLVKEICSTCGNHDPKEHTWLMFPGSDIFARVPFHVAHTVLDKDQERLDYNTKKLQSFVKEKSFAISEKGALADKISPGIVRSFVSLADKPK